MWNPAELSRDQARTGKISQNIAKLKTCDYERNGRANCAFGLFVMQHYHCSLPCQIPCQMTTDDRNEGTNAAGL